VKKSADEVVCFEYAKDSGTEARAEVWVKIGSDRIAPLGTYTANPTSILYSKLKAYANKAATITPASAH
jgi:hypothetical protein